MTTMKNTAFAVMVAACLLLTVSPCHHSKITVSGVIKCQVLSGFTEGANHV